MAAATKPKPATMVAEVVERKPELLILRVKHGLLVRATLKTEVDPACV